MSAALTASTCAGGVEVGRNPTIPRDGGSGALWGCSPGVAQDVGGRGVGIEAPGSPGSLRTPGCGVAGSRLAAAVACALRPSTCHASANV